MMCRSLAGVEKESGKRKRERESDKAKDRTAHAIWNAVLDTKKRGILLREPDRKGGLILIAACELGADEGTDLISWS